MKRKLEGSQFITSRLLVQLTDISVGLMSARGMPLQAKRLISVGAKCNHVFVICQSGVYNLDHWLV